MIRANASSFNNCVHDLLNPHSSIYPHTFDNSFILDDCIIQIMKNFKFIDLKNFELTCKRIHFLAKNAPMWISFHSQLVGFVGLNQLLQVPQNSTHKNIVCNALRELKPEAFLTKAIFYYDNIYIGRDYTKAIEQIHLIKRNETAITPELKIKVDLLHAELLVFKKEFGTEGNDQDENDARDLIQSILKNDFSSEKEKAWASCLIGILFYYSKEDLVINGNVVTDDEIIYLLQMVVNNQHADPSHKDIAILYQDLLYCPPIKEDGSSTDREDDDLSASDEDDLDGTAHYERLYKNSQALHLPSAYKAKCILQMALMDYYDDISNGDEENNRLFAAFQQIIQNEFAFPRDKTSAMLHQAIMTYRDLIRTVTYQEAEEILDQIIQDKGTDFKNQSIAKMYKASMNFANQAQSMTDEEIYETFNLFLQENCPKEPEDIAVAKLNLGLMLIGKRVDHISFDNAKSKAYKLFTDVSQAETSIEELRIQAEYQLSIFPGLHLPSNQGQTSQNQEHHVI
ncbi:MAG: hypothetical protein H0T62_11520 [Parachlamydiaceae bacterium]|nr:hypothetical protein [Parachlamydiaceae bacterium]